jgi:caffeoyl-CoA O-methyltransferase
MNNRKTSAIFLCMIIIAILTPSMAKTQSIAEKLTMDEKVKKFLSDHARDWNEMNIPASDGKLLYNLIIKGNYKKALEIGTSTGHSGIWIAWALSKTGGKLITVDIDMGRLSTAIENFEKAGLSQYIDVRLADAHTLVKELKGPFDFVFSDADKDWYKNYFIDIDPKLVVGGCFTAHNVSPPGRGYGRGQAEFLEYVSSLRNYETTVNTTGGGVSISYKKADK